MVLLILSWNVAGLSTTIQRIHQNYGDKKKQSQSVSPLSNFFKRHGNADIICIQEHKISKSKLIHKTEPHATMLDDEYESFWSCCTDKNNKGFNGVVTYAKKGLVVSANGTTPLQCPQLDKQGRCIMTDHGKFVLFNVYVPNQGPDKLLFLNSLRTAMQRERLRHKHVILVGDLNISRGKLDVHWSNRIVYINDIIQQQVVADANNDNNEDKDNNNKKKKSSSSSIGCGSEEEKERKGKDEDAGSNSSNRLPQWKYDIAKHWEYIARVLETKKVVETQTTNPTTGEKYNKYRLTITDLRTKRLIYLGNHEISSDYCLYPYSFTTYTTEQMDVVEEKEDDDNDNNKVEAVNNNDDQKKVATAVAAAGAGAAADGPPLMSSSENNNTSNNNSDVIFVRIGILVELMSKIVNIKWDQATIQEIAKDAGTVDKHAPHRKWLEEEILREDKMVDVFRFLYPHAQARFTCWNQNKNKRYVNDGARIDYTLTDRALLPYILEKKKNEGGCDNNKGDEDNTNEGTPKIMASSLRCWGPVEDMNSSEAALQAATAHGQFQPVSFRGGGMTEPSQTALDTQFGDGLPHTGHIYTPPTFSDHIAVSLLLSDDIFTTCGDNDSTTTATTTTTKMMPQLTLNTNDATTRKSQPHKQQRSVASYFFDKGNNNGNNNSSSNNNNNGNNSSSNNAAVSSSCTTTTTMPRKTDIMSCGGDDDSATTTTKMPLTLNTNDATTRKAQPQKQQRSVASFFKGNASGNNNAAVSSSCTTTTTTTTSMPSTKANNKARHQLPQSNMAASKTSKANKRRKKIPANSVLHHFQKGR